MISDCVAGKGHMNNAKPQTTGASPGFERGGQ